MDQADQAQQFEQMRRDIALREQSARPRMQPRGHCYNCAVVVSDGCFAMRIAATITN